MERGDAVLSLAGRDRGRLYVVVGVDGVYCYLADGKRRSPLNPKRKKIKHIRHVGSVPEVTDQLRRGEEITENRIRRGLAALRDALCGTE